MLNRLSFAMQITALLALLAANGCCTDEYLTSTCAPLPAGQASGFDVTVRTGSEATDGNIFFCFSLKSDRLDVGTCQNLESSADNFEAGITESFSIDASFPVDAFDTFWLENRGGGIFGEAEWEIDALQVVMRTDMGDTTFYEETNIVCNHELDDGDEYRPGGCTWEE